MNDMHQNDTGLLESRSYSRSRSFKQTEVENGVLHRKNQQNWTLHHRYIRGYRLMWWLGVLLAGGIPLSLIQKVGYAETWDAFNRYIKGMTDLAITHPIRVPVMLDPVHNLTALDEDLIRWQAAMSEIFDKVTNMVLVGVVSDESIGVEFEYLNSAEGEQAGFDARRDVPLMVYFLLSAAAYFSDNVHLALVVLNLNLYNIAICFKLKGLTDAMASAVDACKDAQQQLLMLPMESTMLGLLQQNLCLQKFDNIIDNWSNTELGMSVTVPFIQAVTVSTSIMASLAAATTLRATHVVLYGCIPGLPRIKWRQMLGMVSNARSRLQHQASRMGRAWSSGTNDRKQS